MSKLSTSLAVITLKAAEVEECQEMGSLAAAALSEVAVGFGLEVCGFTLCRFNHTSVTKLRIQSEQYSTGLNPQTFLDLRVNFPTTAEDLVYLEQNLLKELRRTLQVGVVVQCWSECLLPLLAALEHPSTPFREGIVQGQHGYYCCKRNHVPY